MYVYAYLLLSLNVKLPCIVIQRSKLFSKPHSKNIQKKKTIKKINKYEKYICTHVCAHKVMQNWKYEYITNIIHVYCISKTFMRKLLKKTPKYI